MIIDAHLHTFPKGSHIAGAEESGPGLHHKPPRFGSTDWFDPDFSKYLKDMEYLGIDCGINLTNDFGAQLGSLQQADYSIEELNKWYCDQAKKYPGKFFSAIGVSPWRWQAVSLLEQGVKEWGAKALKLLPGTGFYPSDPICFPLYQKAAELEVPVVIHTGAASPSPCKWCDPIYCEEAILRFPNVQFVLAHAGNGLGLQWQQAVSVAYLKPNVAMDFACQSPTVIKGGWAGPNGHFKDHTPQFIDMLDIMRNGLMGGSKNLLFATDYPVMLMQGAREGSMQQLKQWVDLWKNLSSIGAQYGYEFDQDEVEDMLWRNANRIFKLGFPEK